MSLSVVLDTNVLLVSVSSKSPFYWLYKALQEERYHLLLSTAIILEYEEVIEEHMGQDVSDNVVAFLRTAPNVHLVNPHFHWHLIEADPDDNKFADCAIAGRADCIVTHDRHFDERATGIARTLLPVPPGGETEQQQQDYQISQQRCHEGAQSVHHNWDTL